MAFIIRFLNYIDNIFIKLINQEPDPLNKARIRMLGYILVFYTVFCSILVVTYALADLQFHLIRISTVFIITLSLIALGLYSNLWKVISHSILAVITFGVWTNLSIYVRDVNIETLQYIWFACVLSFYIHGSKWGWFYSALNILPVLAFTIADNKNYFFLGGSAHQVTLPIYVFVTFYNFLLITFLQFYFFRSFNKNITSLQIAKNELGSLNEKLNQTLSKVEKLSNSRMEFLSTMSHEIRTPLNGVIGLTNVLLAEAPRKDQEDNLDMLKFSAENLLLLVNNVLDVNKLDSNKTELEKISFDLAELITRNYASSKLKATEKGLDFKLFIDPVLNDKWVISDPTRITQVLLNLINNAIKFTEKGSISVSAQVINVSQSSIKVQFTIEDTGIGISPEKRHVVFEPFIQASANTNRNYGGTGLGLQIVKKTLGLFNSDINFTSEEHVGSKFSFDIDFDYLMLKQPKPKTILEDQNDLAGLCILVAEDNSINRMVINKTLKKWNITPTIVDDGLSALRCIEKEDFDVVLLDLHMPIMDGYTATSHIRNLKDPRKANVFIIALTASVNEKSHRNVIDAKMNDYLPKPFNPDHLFAKLKKISNTL
ncbi:ATP-binding protein [Mariniflexile ostreae]|uniref:histidine kinase n=1 Tax=Mariniflexile ostreae TaxID=1520892 RepID=A0ABV5FBP5_9FLAO